MANWQQVATTHQIPDGTGHEVTVGDYVIALFRVDNDYYAIDGICAHAGGPVAEGNVNDCVVTCPWHGWQYDVSTGHHCLNALIHQRSFPVRVDGDELYVELP